MQVRRAGLATALSAKAQARDVTLVDTFELAQPAAVDAVMALVKENLPSFRDLGSRYVRQSVFRSEVLSEIGGDYKLLEETVEGEGGAPVRRPLPDEVILANIRRTLADSRHVSNLLIRTGTSSCGARMRVWAFKSFSLGLASSARPRHPSPGACHNGRRKGEAAAQLSRPERVRKRMASLSVHPCLAALI